MCIDQHQRAMASRGLSLPVVLANAQLVATKVIASTTLRSSTTAPSPVRLTSRPLWLAIVIDEVAPQRPRQRERPLLVDAGQPGKAAMVAESLRVSVIAGRSRALPGDEKLATVAPFS
jgi:hypothetical protein